MAASTKGRITGYDLQSALVAHIEASKHAYTAAEKAIALRQPGKAQAAIKAEREAKKWLGQAMAIDCFTASASRRTSHNEGYVNQ